jgi:chemotaxis protein MotB
MTVGGPEERRGNAARPVYGRTTGGRGMSGGHNSGGNQRWLLTYADMITLLLAFFVIMYAISKVDLKKYESLAASLQGAFAGSPPPLATRGATTERLLPKPDFVFDVVERLRERLGDDLAAGRVQIERAPDAVVLRFPDAILFERGKAELRLGARQILERVAGVIQGLSNPIEAEGHTDTLPIRSAQFPSNWELSVARATAVVRYLVEAHAVSPVRIAARGVGEHKPLFPNDAVRGEPRNRRVELRIAVR